MEGASTRREPELGVLIALCCCQLQLTKEPLHFPLLSRSWGWDAENRDVEFAAEGPARLYGGWLLLCVE